MQMLQSPDQALHPQVLADVRLAVALFAWGSEQLHVICVTKDV